ncbi:zinc finger protein 571-like [Calliphora vicina]|uniref:zinc finger protein 571-like n=1 Tax=Calliphora vicina TaxID=7373 RepID=UPI00325C2098
MNQTALCRLCIRLYNEFINLFDDNGQSSEAYDIAVKYFDPMLLKPQHEHDTTLICVVCWSHINNFHNFQSSVLNAQVQLENNVEQYIPLIKLEDEAWMDQITILDSENNTLANSNRKFYNRYDMVEHIRVHLNQNTFQCNICGKTFSCNRNLNRHIRQVHIEKVQQVFELMNSSNKSIKYQPSMGLLKANDENISNSKKPYTRSSKITRGKIKITPNSVEKIAGNLEVKKHNMEQKYYQLKISSNKKTTIEYDTQIAELKNILECPVCSRNFPYYTSIREHFHEEHPNVKFHIICCQRRFGNGYQIYEHFQLHKNPNVFKCEICEHTFSRSASLTRHIRELHMQNVQWSCDHCGVCFKSCSVLGRHKKMCEQKIRANAKECNIKLGQQQKMECINVTENYVGATFSNYTLFQISP